MADMKCENCMEWEYFEGFGYGCFATRHMRPSNAEECEFYADKHKHYPWKSHVALKAKSNTHQEAMNRNE